MTKIQHKLALFLLGITPIIFSANPARAVLFDNGDFEAGNTGFSTDYTFISGSTSTTLAGQYAITTNPQNQNSGFTSFGDHTTGTGNMMVVDGSETASDLVWGQTVSVSPNTEYDISAWVASVFADRPAQLEFSINGSQIGSTYTAPSTTGVWDEFTATWNSGSNNSLNLQIVSLDTEAFGNDFALDDFSFTANSSASVPFEFTPSTGLAISFGFFGLHQYQKRRRQKVEDILNK